MNTTMTAHDKRQLQMKQTLRTVLERGKSEFALVLPDHMTPERMVRIAITACTFNPKLLDCTPESVGLALLTASQTGLEPDGYHAHLIPYGKVCQFQPDYKGLIQLALDNDVVIDAAAVYEKDSFSYQLGTQPRIDHVPTEEEDRGALRCAYAVAQFKNGRTKFVVSTRADVMKRKAQGQSSKGSDSPWVKWEATMWVKTAVKALMKFVPRSPAMKAALVADDLVEAGRSPGSMFVPEPRHQESKMEAIVNKLDMSAATHFCSMVETLQAEEFVDKAWKEIVETDRSSMSDEDLERCATARDLQLAVIKGELQ